ncbi:MAG: hypothetical protein KTR30_22725 [Saprospiraceae bacterium]|nr:hypothetical protein [Saprospiraceae bacterium]
MLAHKLYGYVMIFGAQPDEVSGGQQFHISINGCMRWVHESCFIHN